MDYRSISPEIILLQDLILHNADRCPDKAAIITPVDERSFGEVLSKARQYAACLMNLGLKRNGRVAILMENGFDYISAYFGSHLAGAIAVPLDYKATLQAQLKCLLDSEATFLVISSKFSSMASQIFQSNLFPISVISAGKSFDDSSKAFFVVEDYPSKEINVRPNSESPCVINYTSGSLGKPKGVVLSHRAILENTRSIVNYLGLSAMDRVMQILPFSYCYGASLLHTHFMVGGSLAIDNRFMYPSVVLAFMKEKDCTGLAGVPSTFHTIVSRCHIKGIDYPALRYATQAGGRMDPDFTDRVREALAPVPLYVMYGQTEASARLTFLDPAFGKRKKGSAGRPIPGVKLKIVSETGMELPPGETGEIWVQGQNIMDGYWNNPEETAKVLENGWLKTGDLGYQDNEGFLYVQGRSKEIIKSKGYRIHPSEIEGTLLQIPQVLEAAVVGIPDPDEGEAIAAVISTNWDTIKAESEVRSYCRAHLPPFKIPKYLLNVKELPKSASGKVRREELMSLFEHMR